MRLAIFSSALVLAWANAPEAEIGLPMILGVICLSVTFAVMDNWELQKK